MTNAGPRPATVGFFPFGPFGRLAVFGLIPAPWLIACDALWAWPPVRSACWLTLPSGVGVALFAGCPACAFGPLLDGAGFGLIGSSSLRGIGLPCALRSAIFFVRRAFALSTRSCSICFQMCGETECRVPFQPLQGPGCSGVRQATREHI